ncbi:DUF6617 family protein [Chitinophaga sp. sic0106]|uniref:DUF6617 family protein n=1 Tax=Chitinophaga sp. sic0106 TaxID=2854785 RepID=UPI001C44CF2C|nr:DUF6617 family protein [Chitinophaga sp. sic0106]MBV7533045.1 hypothetical protein [Chitinophaga sp. sic0106]
MDNFLTEKDYLVIIEKSYGFSTKHRLKEYILFARKYYRDANEDFWYHFDNAVNGKIPSMDEDEFNLYEDRAYSNENISDSIECLFFIRQLISEIQFAELDAEDIYNNPSLTALPEFLTLLNKNYNAEGFRYQLKKNYINTLTSHVFNLGYLGKGLEESLKPPAKIPLQTLITLYFSIPCKKEECDEQSLIFVERKREQEYQYYRGIKTTKQEFSQLFNEKLTQQGLNENPKKFNAFKTFEINRWRNVVSIFGRLEDEFEIINKYLKFLKQLNKSEFTRTNTNNYYFGILPEHQEKLEILASELLRIGILHKTCTPYQFSTVLTTKSLTKIVPKLYFDCETTTLSYIFDVINLHFSPLKKFNFSMIGRSGLFYIPPEKKPSERNAMKHSSIKSYKLLKRVNLQNSRKRYFEYLKNPESVEYKLNMIVAPIMKKYLLQ